MKKNSVNILGTRYSVEIKNRTEDRLLWERDGYCDRYEHRIVVAKQEKEAYEKEILRHELTHAFLNESGLQDEMTHNERGHDEQMIDWFSIQYPKMKKVYEQLGCDK